MLAAVASHRRLANHVTLTTHVHLHRLIMLVLGRLLDFSGLFERDLYFLSLALLHQAGLTPANGLGEVVRGQERVSVGTDLLERGQILAAIECLPATIRDEISCLFFLSEEFEPQLRRIRNDFAHFNMLKPAGSGMEQAQLDLTYWVQQCRHLMRYDRKLENAVATSIVDLLAREGLDVVWTFEARKGLADAVLASRAAKHLGEIRIGVRGDGSIERAEREPIQEALHADEFVTMAASVFGGAAREAAKDVCRLDLSRVEWEQARKGRQERQPAKSRSLARRRPRSGNASWA